MSGGEGLVSLGGGSGSSGGTTGAPTWAAAANTGSAVTLTSSSTVLNGYDLTLNAATPAITVAVSSGQRVDAMIRQDATGNRDPSWSGVTTWLTRSGVVPSLKFLAAADGPQYFRFYNVNGTTFGEWLNEPHAGRVLDYREYTSVYTVTVSTPTIGTGGITNLVTGNIIGRGYEVLVDVMAPICKDATAANKYTGIWIEGNVNGGAFAQLQLVTASSASTTSGRPAQCAVRQLLTAGSTYVFRAAAYKETGGDTVTITGDPTIPIFMSVTER